MKLTFKNELLFISRSVKVAGRIGHIVDEGQSSRVIFSTSPIGEIKIKEALITS